jgi:hypothetical protein
MATQAALVAQAIYRAWRNVIYALFLQRWSASKAGYQGDGRGVGRGIVMRFFLLLEVEVEPRASRSPGTSTPSRSRRRTRGPEEGMKAFCEPDTSTSIPSRPSGGRTPHHGYSVHYQRQSLPLVRAASSFIGWATVVEVSLACTITALTRVCVHDLLYRGRVNGFAHSTVIQWALRP